MLAEYGTPIAPSTGWDLTDGACTEQVRALAPVLLREQPLVDHLGRVPAAPHAEEAALLLLLVLFEQGERHGQGFRPLRRMYGVTLVA